jgi:hypothetical protein
LIVGISSIALRARVAPHGRCSGHTRDHGAHYSASAIRTHLIESLRRTDRNDCFGMSFVSVQIWRPKIAEFFCGVI